MLDWMVDLQISWLEWERGHPVIVWSFLAIIAGIYAWSVWRDER